MIKIIKKRCDWNTILKNYDQHDFYHTYDYHYVSKERDEEAILIHYTEGDRTIALPLLLRNIKDTQYKDATSVYGYAGPLTQNIDDNFNNTRFKDQLHGFFVENNIISVFSRLHPYIPSQIKVLIGIGEISNIGNIVNIDLTKDLDTQRQGYNKRLKTYINKARRAYTIKKTQTECDILKFRELYHENMYRVNANSSYYFDLDYFLGLLHSDSFKTELLLAFCNATQEAVGGAMFIKKNNIVQYHLSGAKNEYLHLNPIKLLIDEARISSTKENYTYFNLGGGKGGGDDSLFHFKAGFSKDLRMFSIWKYIVNIEIYDNLLNETLQNVPEDQRKEYFAQFPNYRCNP